MGKTLNNLLTSPISIVLGEKIGGVVSGASIAVIGALTGNPVLIAYGLNRIANSLAKTSKPQTTETTIKQPRPPRISAYGEVRHRSSYIL